MQKLSFFCQKRENERNTFSNNRTIAPSHTQKMLIFEIQMNDCEGEETGAQHSRQLANEPNAELAQN